MIDCWEIALTKCDDTLGVLGNCVLHFGYRGGVFGF